jgi:hypothetical protein
MTLPNFTHLVVIQDMILKRKIQRGDWSSVKMMLALMYTPILVDHSFCHKTAVASFEYSHRLGMYIAATIMPGIRTNGSRSIPLPHFYLISTCQSVACAIQN